MTPSDIKTQVVIVAIESIICVERVKETVQHHNTGLFSVWYALQMKKESGFQQLIKQSTTRR
jgi:hypothetical protein